MSLSDREFMKGFRRAEAAVRRFGESVRRALAAQRKPWAGLVDCDAVPGEWSKVDNVSERDVVINFLVAGGAADACRAILTVLGTVNRDEYGGREPGCLMVVGCDTQRGTNDRLHGSIRLRERSPWEWPSLDAVLMESYLGPIVARVYYRKPFTELLPPVEPWGDGE